MQKLVVGLLAASFALLAAAHPAWAHEPGASAVDMTPTATGLDIRIEAPLAELSEALDLDLPSDVFGLSQIREPIVVPDSDLQSNLSITTQDGDPWPLAVQRLTVVQIDGIQFLRFDVEVRV